MAVANEYRDSWLSGEQVPGVDLRLNDSVEITGGPKQGETGAVISLEHVDPEPTFLVELGATGSEITLPQSMLRRLD